MALDETISGLIGRIYDSVDDPARWERVLEDVRDALGVHCLLQSVSDLHQNSVHGACVIGAPRRSACIEEWEDYAFEQDPTFGWAMNHPTARFCDTEEIIPKTDYLNDEFIRWNRHEGIGSTHWLLGYTAPDVDLTFGLSAHPSPDVGPLRTETKRLFKMLFEHMERAVRLQARPPHFACADEAAVLLDRLGHVRAMSPAARDLIERRDGLFEWNSELHAANCDATARLNAAILSALSALEEGGFGGAVALPRPSGKRDLLVTVSPLVKTPSPFQAFRPAALLRIIDREMTASPSAGERWACLFGLTPAEARFAEALICRDQNLRHAANELGVTYATARVHLRHLLEKTGTHSQAQLARLLTLVE